MEFWYYETGGHTSDEMIVGTEFFAGNRYGIYSHGYGFLPYIRDNSTFLGISPYSEIPYNMNQWHHVAITYDGNNFHFWVDGDEKFNDSGTVTNFGLISEDLVINRHTEYREVVQDFQAS